MVTISTPALLTDHYELTMLQGALRSGAAERRSVFEVFTRRLPEGRRYGVVAGTGRVIEEVGEFRFTAEQLEFLERTAVVDRATLDWLADYRFRGSISGYREGECYFPGSPILTVEGGLPDGLRGERTAVHRDGLAAHSRGCGGGQRPGGVPGRVRLDLEPRGRVPP